jgi:hypothetical protein
MMGVLLIGEGIGGMIIPEEFKQIDIDINMAANESYGNVSLESITLVAITSTGDEDEVVIPVASGGDAYELIGDVSSLRLLSHFSRFGVFAPGTIHVTPKDAVKKDFSEEDIEAFPSYRTTSFLCWWDGRILCATRVLRPDGCGDEESPEGIRYGVPEYSDGARGQLVDALTAAALTGQVLRHAAELKTKEESDD